MSDATPPPYAFTVTGRNQDALRIFQARVKRLAEEIAEKALDSRFPSEALAASPMVGPVVEVRP